MLTEVETRSDKRFFLHFAARAVFEAGDVHAFLNLVAARALFEEGGVHAFLNYFVAAPLPGLCTLPFQNPLSTSLLHALELVR